MVIVLLYLIWCQGKAINELKTDVGKLQGKVDNDKSTSVSVKKRLPSDISVSYHEIHIILYCAHPYGSHTCRLQ